MHVIVDGYNVLGFTGRMGPHTGPGGATHLEAAREALLKDLGTYRQRKGHAITVVFDGWKQGLSIERQEHRAGVGVIYSRRGEKADVVIQRLADQYGSQAAVVSSDREVTDYARARGAFVLTAAEFIASLVGPDSFADPRRTASFDPESKKADDDAPFSKRTEKKGNPRKLPKRVRQRRQRLKRF